MHVAAAAPILTQYFICLYKSINVKCCVYYYFVLTQVERGLQVSATLGKALILVSILRATCTWGGVIAKGAFKKFNNSQKRKFVIIFLKNPPPPRKGN